jgi:hypothetical protein
VTDNEITSIVRKEAASGRVSYGNALILHESSRTRISMVPWFIQHTGYTELAIKLQSFKKAPPPNDWVFVEEKSINLNGPASQRLLQALRDHLAVAEQGSDGSFLLLKVSEGTADIGDHDPQLVASALAKVLSQEESVKHLSGADLSDELVQSLRSAIRLREMQAAVADLRDMLERGENDEQAYQDWCQTHSWAFGSAYVVNDEVRNISASDNLDLLLPTVIAGYRDLVELKRPDMMVLRHDNAHRNHYWSADVSRAIGQCHRYLDILHEVAANGLRDHPEIVAYHPRAIIVIGRSNEWGASELRALHGLNHRLSSVTVMTYDQLLAQGERLLSIVSPCHVDETPERDPWDEDISF